MNPVWIAVGREQDLRAGIQSVEAGGERLLICSLEGELFATTTKCPHAGVPMDRAEIEGTLLTCPLHGWRFDVRCAGKEIHGYPGLQTRRVRIEGGTIYVAARAQLCPPRHQED
jgi:nitrite reductase (NADH) small subunit